MTCGLNHEQAFVNLVQGPDDDGTRLVVLPAFETLPFKSRGNDIEDEMAHKVAEFATTASKDAIKVSGDEVVVFAKLQLLYCSGCIPRPQL